MNYQIQMPRSVGIIKEQLADLSKVINSYDHNLSKDFVSKLFLDSIEAHEAELKEELEAAQWLEKPYDMELTLAGPSVVKHSIPVNILSKLLDQVQKLRLATAQIAEGTYRDSGRFSNKLLEQNKLMVECFNPSSFTIQLTYAHENQISLFPNSDTVRPGEDLFLTLLSSETDFEDFKTVTMSPKFRSYYQDFLSFLSKNNVMISTRTKNHPYSVQMSPDNARDRKKLLNFTLKSEQSKKEEGIDGKLVMGDIKNNLFNIEGDTGNIKGQVSEKGIEDLKMVSLGSKVHAKLLVTTSTEDAGQPSYTLLSLKGE
jgi:hypothetical protein